jgi:hypothetical protein
LIGQFNKGQQRRFEHEMDAKTSELFVDTFAQYYRNFFPEEVKGMKKTQFLSSALAEAVAPTGTQVTAPRHDGRSEMTNPGMNALGPVTASDSAPKLIDQLVTATFRAVLGRPADPSGLQTYRKLFMGASLPHGVERVVQGLLGSPEFQNKRAVAEKQSNSPPDAPHICAFTPDEARWVSSLDTRLDRVLVAQFRPEPGSRPTIHLQDRSLVTVDRVLHSLKYIETLISKYLLNPDYYYFHFSAVAPHVLNLFCVFQIYDQSVDVDQAAAYCGKSLKLTLIPDLHFWISNGYFNLRREFSKSWVPWEDRVPKAFWRGSSTGAKLITLGAFPHLPRFRLCAAGASSTRFRGMLDAKLTDIVQASDQDEARKIWAYVDSLGLLSAHVPQADFLKYRFQIDIDGNSNSWGFLPKLMMGSCVLKVMSDWRQWYYEGLRPWEHYVPIKNDLSDLEERVAWCLDNDNNAREIGANGMKYANGIVFGTEMLRAASSVLQASRETLGAAS